MTRDDKKLIFLAFLFALVPTVICPVAMPRLRLIFFAPFLALMFYKRPLSYCLWYSVACGLIIDLLTANTRLGLHVINYCITTTLLYGQTRHFFEDKISTLPVVTFLFSLISTLLQVIMLRAVGDPLLPSWLWAATDLVAFPLADALYALVWFAIPAYLLRRRPQNRDNTLCLREKG